MNEKKRNMRGAPSLVSSRAPVAKMTAPKRRTEPRGTGGRPTRGEAESRNERIIAVATELFLSHGYSDVSLGMIARSAGVAKRTLYDWYGDKAAIFSAVIHSDAARIETDAVAGEATNRSAENALFRLAQRIRDVTLDPLTSSILQLMVGESKKFPELISTLSRVGSEDMYNIVHRALLELKDKDKLAFPATDSEKLAIRFLDLVVGISSLRKTMEADFPITPDKEIRERVRMFVLHLAPTSTPPSVT